MKTALVVIPTYNESQNIQIVVSRLFALRSEQKTPYDIEVLVVDDQSPDGTADVVRHLQQRYAKLHLLLGVKNGLGMAYRRGFDYAREHLEFDVVVMMDADLSHNPSDVARLLQAIDKGYDVAIGSRFTRGGMIPGNWPIIRILNTKVAHFVARFVGGIETELAELTGGFKAMRKSALEKIPYREANVNGFGFQLFLSNAFVNLGFRNVEVPICFNDRRAGNSKLSRKDITEFIKIAYELNNDSPFKSVLHQSIAGIIGVTLTIGTYILISFELNLGAIVAMIVAAELGIVSFIAALLTLDRTSSKGLKMRKRIRHLLGKKTSQVLLLILPLLTAAMAASQASWTASILLIVIVAVALFGFRSPLFTSRRTR